jgi:hypothetical protein
VPSKPTLPTVTDVAVRASDVHGRGLYATRDHAAGEVAAEAHVLVLDEADVDALAEHPLAAYLVSWDDQRAALPFGPLSFVNHDLQPNAELVVDHDLGVVQLVTRRAVADGEELSIDYGPDHPV